VALVPQPLFPQGAILPYIMVAFACDRCGKCCVSLGHLVTIDRQLNDRDYYCHGKIDNAIFLAHVDPDFCEEIADEFAEGIVAHSGHEKKPCLFLRKNFQNDTALCAIYSTRPKVCKDFRCYHTLIYNREGMICGKVIGKNTLRTDDPAIEKLWNGQVVPIPCGDPAAWIKRVAGVLAYHSYRAETVE
jgi:uncharacterized protein